MKSKTITHRPAIYRIYRIDQYIKSKCFPNTPFLAEKLEVSKRTIERDVEYMRDNLCAPITYCHIKKGYYYETNFQLPSLQLTEGEFVALYFGQKIVSSCLGTSLERPIKNAFEKIMSLSQETVSIDFGKVEESTSFNFEPIRGEEQKVTELYESISRAITNQRSIWLRYHSASKDEITERCIDPYHIRYHQGVWYLIGYCHLRRQIRHFALDRIHSLKETDQNFTVIKDFHLENYLKSALGVEWGTETQEVIIHFDPHQARWIREREWHFTQKIQEQKDGSLVLSLQVNGLGEVKRWIMGFGKHAKVIKPMILQQEIIEEIGEMMTKYCL